MSKKQVDAESAGEDSACEITPSNEPSEENSEGEETALSNGTMSQLSGEQESVPEETSLGESDGEGKGCDGKETQEKCCVCVLQRSMFVVVGSVKLHRIAPKLVRNPIWIIIPPTVLQSFSAISCRWIICTRT